MKLQPFDANRRTATRIRPPRRLYLATLGPNERQSLWQSNDNTTTAPLYAWLDNPPKGGSPQWYTAKPNHWGGWDQWQPSVCGVQDVTTHRITSGTRTDDGIYFDEVMRQQDDGRYVYLVGGSAWLLG